MARSLYYIGHANLLKKDYTKSLKYLQSALSIGGYLPYDEDRKDTYQSLATVSAARNDNTSAYAYAIKLHQLNDSILNYDRIKAINDLSIKHQADEKTKDIRLLEIENRSVLQKILLTRSALYFVAAGFFLLLVALYFIIRFYSQKIKAEKIMNEQQHEIDQQKIRELEDNIKISSMQSMIVGQERERERIAVDLHDSLGGLLSTVKLQFDNVKSKLNGNVNLEQYDKATNLLDTAVEEVRNISRNLQPGALKDLGLVSAIKDLINRFDSDTYPEIFFQYYNLEDKIDEMTALSIYRIIQELITNTIKHAGASEILLQMTREGEELVIEYEDDGKGINPETTVKKKGMGLENINSRVKYLKGSISVNSREQEGVSYLIRLPYDKVSAADV
ncbi:MAG: sensor histidine kinase [Saprospiraceae bacterium]|nr:sensor histidine kinase [Saprospiraceae bacterium]